SERWMEEMFKYRHMFTGDYLHWFSGDDLVYPGFYKAASEALRRFPQAGVVFSNYHHATYDLRVYARRVSSLSEVSFMHGELLHRHLCRPWLVEGAMATLMKLDQYQWLADHKFYELGPWADSMGYPIVAMKLGAIFLPQVFGCVRVYGNAFSVETGRDVER